MPAYNPHDTLTVEFREVELALGAPGRASQLFDVIRLNRSLARLQTLADDIAREERSAAVDTLLETLREFNEVSGLVDVLIAAAYAARNDDSCIACALTAGGRCADHAEPPA